MSAQGPCCDRCGKELVPGALKFNVRLTVTADFDGHLGPEADEHRTQDLEEALASAQQLSEDELMAGVHQELAFHICARCRAALLEDPLAGGFLRHGGGMVQ